MSWRIPTKLKIVIQKSTSGKNLACEYCDKKFNKSILMKKEKRIHNYEKPFACEYCEKKFNQIRQTTKYKRIHTGEKPFACEYCDKNFVNLRQN